MAGTKTPRRWGMGAGRGVGAGGTIPNATLSSSE